MNPDSFKKGIQVGAGGILRLFGAKGVPLYDQNGVRKPESGVSWTHLSKPGGPKFDPNFALFTPDTKQYFTEISPVTSKPTGVKAPVSAADIGTDGQTLHPVDDVTQGDNPSQVGDWSIVATTTFSPFESEFVKIIDVNKEPTETGSFVVVANGLRHYHFGGLDPGPPSDKNYDNDNNTNFGVDKRAEVGLISRNIMLTSEVSSVQDQWGGEIKVWPGFAKARIECVELEKFGKDKLGSYPLHFHMLGDVQGNTTVKANSVHHSYNKKRFLMTLTA